MKHLIVISILVFHPGGSLADAQDTLALEPDSIIEWNHITFIENNRMVSLEYYDPVYDEWYYINVYDITDADHPELISHLAGLILPSRNERGGYNGEITDTYLLEDAVIWTTCQECHWIHVEGSFGPILLRGYQFSMEDGWGWNRELSGRVAYDDSYAYPGNIARYEDFLVVAGGQAGIQIYDISQLDDPNLVGSIDSRERTITVIEDRLLIFQSGLTQIHLFDINDPEQPLDIGSFRINSNECPYILQEDHVIYDNCLVLRNNPQRDPHSSLLLLDVLSNEDPRDGEIIELDREYGAFRFYIANDRLFVYPSAGDFIDVYDIDDNLEVNYTASISPSEMPGSHFIVHDDKLIFEKQHTIIIYQIPPELHIHEPELTPVEFSFSVFPNPFNSCTTMEYTLPSQSNVTLQVYNTRGQLVDLLLDRVMPAGRSSLVWDASSISAGVYLVRMSVQDNSFTELRKVVLVK